MTVFVTTDPRSGGLAATVGSIAVYVTAGAGTRLLKYGTGSTDWATIPALDGAEPVTADPRSGGLARPVGATAMYVTGGVGTLLYKYGPVAANWATVGDLTIAAVSGLSSSLGALQPLDADLTALAASPATAGLVERTAAATYDTRLLGVAAATSVPTRADADTRYAAASHGHTEADLTLAGTGVLVGGGPGVASELTVTAAIDILNTTAGALLYRKTSSGEWGGLVPSVAGLVLTSNGVGADPSYQASAGGGVSDGDKGDIVVSGGGVTWEFDSGVVTAAAKTVLDDATVAAMLATMGGAPLASPTFTGVPAAPTAAAGTNTTQLATTAFVRAEVANGLGLTIATHLHMLMP